MGSTTKKVALITGGASGMGRAVGTALARQGDWHVHLLDMNTKYEKEVLAALGTSATFHKVDITDYAALTAVFERVFKTANRLDFVYANAGIVERFSFYEKHPITGPPPELDTRVLDVNLKAVCTTSYLALHYLRQSPSEDPSLVMTASCGGFYGCPSSAMYCATKHGVLGFMRSVAPRYILDGVRVNAICPSIVATNLLEKETWDSMPQGAMTPIDMIAKTVLALVKGDEMIDSKGNRIEKGQVNGKAVELIARDSYFRDQIEFCNEMMEVMMTSTNADQF